jgi:hypothetical protein
MDQWKALDCCQSRARERRERCAIDPIDGSMEGAGLLPEPGERKEREMRH